MIEFSTTIKELPWLLISVIGFSTVNLCFTSLLLFKIKKLKAGNIISNSQIRENLNDIKALFQSGSTLGGKIKSLEFAVKIMKEEQEQISLKEPSQQTYRNAVELIKQGESVTTISESSGLALGEIELLKLFQRIENDTSKKKDSLVK